MLETQGIRLDVGAAEKFLAAGAIDGLAERVAAVATELENGQGPGAEYLGWLALPGAITEADLAAM